MPDRELSTRDLAGQTATDEDARLATAQGSELESAQGDEPLMRERAAGGSGTRDANDAPGSTVEPVTPAAEREPLLSPDQGESFTTRWREIQASFVDEPREAVAEADSELLQRARAARSPVGPGRRRLHRRPPRCSHPLPLVLRPPSRGLGHAVRNRPNAIGVVIFVTEQEEDLVSILWIILIVVLVLVLVGGFGMRGRW
jgi:hypothetical protein